MTSWRSQSFRATALENGNSVEVIDNAVAIARILQAKTPGAVPIFSLRHLARLTRSDYQSLRAVVARHDNEPYRQFPIKKRPLRNEQRRFRIITVPAPWLMDLQRWITANVLSKAQPHEASTAFSKGNKLVDAASYHCQCRWLIKIDIQNFFESITESQVYAVFKRIGYQPLVALELARLCTRVGNPATRRHHKRFRVNGSHWSAIRQYQNFTRGHLPQGAPSSPMLANLVARDLDRALIKVAEKRGMIYTRYADDLTFSTRSDCWPERAPQPRRRRARQRAAALLPVGRRSTRRVRPLVPRQFLRADRASETVV